MARTDKLNLIVEEQDGNPSVECVHTIKVSNGTLTDDGDGVVSITTGGGGGGSGDVVGPGSSTDNALTRFDGITGKLIQNSSVNLSDLGVVTGLSLDADGSGNVITNIGSSEVKSDIITGQSTVTAISGDFILLSDTSDSGNLKKANVSDFLAGTGDVNGPVSSTDEALARFDGLTGKIIQNSAISVSDTGVMAGALISGSTNTFSAIPTSAAALTTGLDSAFATGTSGTSGDLVLWNADGDIVDGPTPPSGTIVGTTDAQTLTNKTIDLTDNTLSGTTAEFNTALSDNDFATLSGSETITNKTVDADNNTITNIGSTEIKSEMITGQTTVTGISGDFVLISDTSDSGNLKKVDVVDFLQGTGDVIGPASATNEAIARFDLTTGKLIQNSSVLISDSGDISGVLSVSMDGSTSGSTILLPSAVASGTLTLPAATDTLVGKSTTDTFTNKTINADATGNVITNIGSSEIKSEIITGQATVTGISGDFVLISDTSDAGTLKKVDVSDFLGDGGDVVGPAVSTDNAISRFDSTTGKLIQNSIVSISDLGSITGAISLSMDGSTSGSTILQPSSTASGTLTLPAATDTLVGRDTTDTLTNKTIDGNNNTLTVLASSQLSGVTPVANGGTGASSLTDGGILLGSGSGPITALGVATNGQIPIGDGSGDPVLASITGGSNLTVVNGAGSITLDVDDSFLLNTGDTGTGAYDFGGATSFEIPNSSTPTVNADGEIAIDTTVTDFDEGIIKYFSAAEMGVVAMPIAQFTNPVDGTVVTYNATDNNFELVSGSGTGDVTSASNITDNSIVRGDGGAKGVQQSGILIDDSNNISESGNFTFNDQAIAIKIEDSSSGNGGDLTINSGNSGDSSAGGLLTIQAGNGGGSGTGGNTVIAGGDDMTTGSVLVRGGNGEGGSNATLQGGSSDVTDGGNAVVVGGASTSGSDVGGNVLIYPGDPNGGTDGVVVLAHTGSSTRGGVTIGDNILENTAITEITSTTLGFLMPRMTTTQRDAISTPATGLLVWNTTTTTLNEYTGSVWQALGGGGGGTPGGSDTQMQYNNGGSFGGASGLLYNDTSDVTTSIIDDATTNSVLRPFIIRRTTSGTAANGIGSGVSFETEDNVGSIEEIGNIDFSFNANNFSTFQVRALTGGVLNTVLNVSGDGDVIPKANSVWDLASVLNLIIPNSNSPIVNSSGTLGIDNLVTDWSHGILQYYSGEKMGVVALPDSEFTTPSGGSVVSYNATDDEFQLKDRISNVTFVIDGGGASIATGIKGDLQIDFDCEIQQVTMLADQAGSIVVDIWKDTYANFPATDADSITSSATPTISSSNKSQDSTLTGWTTSITAGDHLRYNVDSVTDIERVTISLQIKKT